MLPSFASSDINSDPFQLLVDLASATLLIGLQKPKGIIPIGGWYFSGERRYGQSRRQYAAGCSLHTLRRLNL